jgi:hypothetical protein
METATSTRSASYFYTLSNTLSLNAAAITEGGGGGRRDSGENDKKKKYSKTKNKSHKFSNIDAKAFVSVINASKFDFKI